MIGSAKKAFWRLVGGQRFNLLLLLMIQHMIPKFSLNVMIAMEFNRAGGMQRK